LKKKFDNFQLDNETTEGGSMKGHLYIYQLFDAQF